MSTVDAAPSVGVAPALQAIGIRRRLGGRDVLDGVDLEVAQGELASDALQHLLDGQLRGIQLNGIGRRLKRGHCALGVTLIARTDLI